MGKAQVLIQHTYPVKPQRIWQAITDPQQMKQWYMPVDEFQAEVGFETEFAHHYENKSFAHAWQVTEVIPEKKISYEWQVKGFPGNSLVSFELTKQGDTTHLKLTHVGIESFEGQKHPGLETFNFRQGWTALIGTLLRDFVEKVEVAVA